MKNRIRTLLCWVVISFLIVKVGYAENSDELQLTVQDAIEIVLMHNLGLRLERITPEIKKENLASAAAEFDSQISFSGAHSRLETDEDPMKIKSAENSVEAGIEKTYPYGTSIALNMALMEDSNVANSPSGQDGSSLMTVLAVTQPLLKNRGRDVNERQIMIAENEFRKSELSFKQTLIDTIAQTKRLYWQTYSANEQMKVQQKSLLLAEQFLNEVEEKVKVGSAAALEILEASAEVASREDALIRAEYDLMNSQDNLLSYIYGGLKETRSVRCVQAPQIQEHVFNEESLVQKAFDMRSEYQSAAYDIASAQVDSAYYRNQKKAQLDVIGSLGYNKALTEEDRRPLSYQDYYNGEIKLSLQFPWGFRRDDANYRAALQSLKQSTIQRDRIDAQIRLELRTAVRSVRSAHKQFQSASLAAQLAEEKLAAEEEKYKSGLSTSYNVLLYQRDLINAMVNRVESIINYQLAIIFLNKAAGITLEENGIEIRDLQ